MYIPQSFKIYIFLLLFCSIFWCLLDWHSRSSASRFWHWDLSPFLLQGLCSLMLQSGSWNAQPTVDGNFMQSEGEAISVSAHQFCSTASVDSMPDWYSVLLLPATIRVTISPQPYVLFANKAELQAIILWKGQRFLCLTHSAHFEEYGPCSQFTNCTLLLFHQLQKGNTAPSLYLWIHRQKSRHTEQRNDPNSPFIKTYTVSLLLKGDVRKSQCGIWLVKGKGKVPARVNCKLFTGTWTTHSHPHLTTSWRFKQTDGVLDKSVRSACS